jgi:hypothetical protein
MCLLYLLILFRRRSRTLFSSCAVYLFYSEILSTTKYAFFHCHQICHFKDLLWFSSLSSTRYFRLRRLSTDHPPLPLPPNMSQTDTLDFVNSLLNLVLFTTVERLRVTKTTKTTDLQSALLIYP